MKKRLKQIAVFVLTAVLMMESTPISASATTVSEGKLGDNNGFEYTYDADAKTLIVTGKDSGLSLDNIGTTAETIVLRDCTIIGSASSLFLFCANVTEIVFDNFDTSQITDMSQMFNNCSKVTELDVSSFDTSSVTNMYAMFVGCSGLTDLDVSNFNTSNVTNMMVMFAGCTRLNSLDISGFEMESVTEMDSMLQACNNLSVIQTPASMAEGQSINLYAAFLDAQQNSTTAITPDFCDMTLTKEETEPEPVLPGGTLGDNDKFQYAYDEEAKTLIITGEDSGLELPMVAEQAERVILRDCTIIGSASDLFRGYDNLMAIEFDNFDSSKITDMSNMFLNCSGLTALDLSSFDTSSVEYMGNMFFGCSGLTSLDVNGMDTSQVTDMTGMFSGCDSLTSLDVSGLDTAQVTSMTSMFDCRNLRYLDISGFDTSLAGATVNEMLSNCSQLVIVKTPKAMAEEQSITLPYTFWNWQTDKEETDVITAKWCNETLAQAGNTTDLQADASEMAVGENLQMNVIVDGMQLVGINGYYNWSVDSEGVITVSDTGLVNAVGMGTATVICVHKVNPSQMAIFEITVNEPFKDIESTDWQYPYVKYVYENNLMSGKGDGNFDMNGDLTRAEFVTVLYNYSGKPETVFEQQFTDVNSTDWFARFVTWAKNNNVTAGNADGTFGAYNNITREQLVVMLYKFAKSVGEVTEVTEYDLTEYADLDQMSSWATEAFEWAVANNIITGKNTEAAKYLDPKGNTARGECATMMMKYVELTK